MYVVLTDGTLMAHDLRQHLQWRGSIGVHKSEINK